MSKKKKVPREVHDKIVAHFKDSFDSHERLMQVVRISRSGMHALQIVPNALRLIEKVAKEKRLPHETKTEFMTKTDFMAERESDAEFAKEELSRDFAAVNSLASVALWSWLEHLVKDLLVIWIATQRSALKNPAIQGLKIRAGDYVGLAKFQQAIRLVETFERESSSSLKRGVEKFQVLLEPFELWRSPERESQKSIFELQQVRNAIAHRNGRCDLKLKRECPWLELEIGQEIRVGSKQLERYSRACWGLALEILYRVGDAHNTDFRDEEPSPSTDDTA